MIQARLSNAARALAVAAVGLLVSCQSLGRAPREVELAIANVTVIDPETRRVLPRRTVYIDAGRIVGMVGDERRASFVPRRQVEGRDRFLIPGLMDMHVHLFLPEPSAPSMNLLLAHGVTGIREMSSDCWAAAGATKGCVAAYRALQASVREGTTAGPELLALTSTMVMGPSRGALPAGVPSFITPASEAEAQQLVAYFAPRGVDLIKTHDSVPTAAFETLMREADRHGMKVGGHVPFAAGSVGAARLGYDSIEHARDLLYDCSRYGPEFRRREAAFADRATGAERPASLERLTRTVAEHDPVLCRRTLEDLRATGVHYVPTHVTREMEALADEPDYREDAGRRYVLAQRNARWEADLTETAALPEPERRALDDFFRHGLTITGHAFRAGIPIMAGTDANDTMIVPGRSLHRELRLLNQAGLPNMEVLRTATTVPAAYLGRSDLGGVAVGKEADLVLLRRNPLEDISNTETVEAVIANGRVFDRAALDALLADVERMAR